ncbi:protein mono-ADP-ribosyltransferase PARP12-like [Cololabis saira]|uniref:protein mono-ADP-ribosyltransferase PARP12-like n=1 Tax=Cololabis saira TaxID=129043 RepID=UPI002AD55421|nr:protein mono-ADP-ribosyltransferase PARP12-like [Cololabis saira]
MEAGIFKYICGNQGAVNVDDIRYNLFPGDSTNDILRNQQKFALSFASGEQKVVARTSVKLCRVKGCVDGTCTGLHLCKNFLFSGACHYSQQGRICSFSHELNSGHNRNVLRKHDLEGLDRAELCTLLLQSDYMFLPSICHNYNNGEGEFGRCNEGAGCKRLHICQNFVSRDCGCHKNHDFNATQTLKNLHDRGVPVALIPSLRGIYANKEVLRLADIRRGHGQRGNHHGRHNSAENSGEGPSQFTNRGRGRGGARRARGMRGNMGNRTDQQLTASLSDILDNLDMLDLYSGMGEGLNSSTSDISVAADDTDASSEGGRGRQRRKNLQPGRGRGTGRGGYRGNSQQPQRTPTEICMYFIKGHCKHMERCFKAHDKMPYRWEVQDGDRWTALPENETIEKDYCDPLNSYSTSSPPVYFDAMICGEKKVRRLSTMSSVVEPNFILTTEWLWYWEDEHGNWNLYAADGDGHKPADMDSATLEQKFLNDDNDVVEFMAGSQAYSLSFKDMMQMNKRYGTMRVVRRRPRFVSIVNVREIRARRPHTNSTPVPDNWDKTKIPQTGFSRVSVKRSSDEFQAVEALFCTTMQGFDITSIERIQNKALWEVFQWQKNRMKNNNGGRNVTEKQLFHGTDSKALENICEDNFDWRICGVHGTVYGQGSYFARDAKYSHNYTGDSIIRNMFLSRVLVGSYTRGASDYRRPPPKDGADKTFYDSCVDNVTNPSIYVVFDKLQIYPEYLIQYRTTHPLVDLVSRASASAPVRQPTITPKPILKPVAPPITAASVFQSSTASTSASLQRPTITPTLKPVTASLYQSSTASASTSTSVHQPTITPQPTPKPVTTPIKINPSVFQSSTASTSASLKPVPTRTRPAHSLYQPHTLSYQTSTASPLYQPSPARQSFQHSPSLSGRPEPKKKPDSCLIS